MNEYVFISYKSEQKYIALKIKNILEENNISCWMAPESIPGGANYAAEITNAINNCKEFLIILSSLSQNSKHVLRELDSALQRDKNILPFVIEEFSFNASIDYYLRTVNLYSAYLSWESSLEKLIREIRYNFESIDITRTPDTILNDPIKINSSLPHYFESGYLLFNRYKIINLLNIFNGTQQHYLGLDLHTNQNILIEYIDKTLPLKDISHGVTIAGTYIQHPYIATAIDEYSNESYFIHIQPFYDYPSLQQIISKNGVQNEQTVLKWAKAICHAMIYLNDEKGYAYCQMTPQNIRLREDGLPILFDISVAIPLNSTIKYSYPSCSPPECQKTKCIAKPTIDIYSLGINIYFALTGNSYKDDYLTKHFDPISKNNAISKDLKRILQRCLHPLPNERYQNFRELLQEIEYKESTLNKPKKFPNIFKKLNTF